MNGNGIVRERLHEEFFQKQNVHMKEKSRADECPGEMPADLLFGNMRQEDAMLMEKIPNTRNVMADTAGLLYHVIVVALSAGIALSLPAIARRFLTQWALVENSEVYLITVEMMVAIVLIITFNYFRTSLRDRSLAKMATGAGLTAFLPWRKLSAQREIRRLIEKQGVGRTVMVIGSTGYGTFVDEQGDLHTVLGKCLGVNVLLVNPYSQHAIRRIDAVLHPHFTIEKFQTEVRESIALLKRLRASGKVVKLKLYSDRPLVKLTILGDYLWLKHYHTDLDVQTMPQYVFRHNDEDHGLYSLFCEYFVQRWENPDIPEYDFDTDELLYRGQNGGIVTTRERFGMGEGSGSDWPGSPQPEGQSCDQGRSPAVC